MDPFVPFQRFADLLTYHWVGLLPGSYWGEALDFFVYDTLKIGVLLVLINYVMAVTRYYFPVERARDLLARSRWSGLNYLLAALLGIVTPFCSCSSIPLFIGFLSAGIPLGITFAFLIASPLINESSLYLFPALFGFKVTLFYNAAGVGIAMLGGWVIGRLGPERYIRPEFLKFKGRAQLIAEQGGQELPPVQLAAFFWKDGMAITREIFPYVLLGVGLGAAIHGFVPASFAERYLAGRDWWAVPLAAVAGAPFYANSISVLPVMEALLGKGVPLGTVLTFMTSIVTLSLPSALMLNKVMRWPLLAIFFGVTLLGIIGMGYFFNAFF